MSSCDVDVNDFVKKIAAPLIGIESSQTGISLIPDFKNDSDDIVCSGLTIKRLNRENISESDLGGINEDATTFFLINRSVTSKTQSQFNWFKSTEADTYDITNRLGVHMPRSIGVLYIEHTKSATGRLLVLYLGNLPREIITYRGNGSLVDYYLNTSYGKRQAGSTNKFNHCGLRRLMIGNGNNLNEGKTMYFYGLFFYNRLPTDKEVNSMLINCKNHLKNLTNKEECI